MNKKPTIMEEATENASRAVQKAIVEQNDRLLGIKKPSEIIKERFRELRQENLKEFKWYKSPEYMSWMNNQLLWQSLMEYLDNLKK